MRSEFAADQALKRVAFTLQLRDGVAEVYDQVHRNLWPEMRDMLKRAGISDYSIQDRQRLVDALLQLKRGTAPKEIQANAAAPPVSGVRIKRYRNE